MDFGTIWTWLGVTVNQETLAWVGGAVVAIGGALWAAYKAMSEKEQAASIIQNNQHNSGKQVNIGSVSGGNVNVNQHSGKL